MAGLWRRRVRDHGLQAKGRVAPSPLLVQRRSDELRDHRCLFVDRKPDLTLEAVGYLDRYSRHASRMSLPLNRIVRSSNTSAPARNSASCGREFRVVYSTWRVTGPFTV